MLSIAFLFDIAAKATLMLAAAWLLVLALRRASASARYFTWTCALAALMALPALSLLLPRWNLPVKTSLAAPAPIARHSVVTGRTPAGLPRLTSPSAPAAVSAGRTIFWPLAIWMAGVFLTLARLAAGHARLAWSLRRTRGLDDPDWQTSRDHAAALIGLRRVIRLTASSETDVPLTCGILATSVVLPAQAAEWDDGRRQVVLLHELTHARRRDPLLWLMAQVAAAIYWFHPLAWVALARFRREQERSCDDAVLRAGAGRSAYARHLVELARTVAPASAYAAALGMAATSDLEHRVRALLDPARNRQGLRPTACMAMAVAAFAAILPLAALHAQDSSQPPAVSGTVRDPSGAVVPNVLVLLNNNTSHQEAARTNAVGQFNFAVPSGSYTLDVRAPGFAEFRKAIVLPGDAHTSITLDVGSVTEAVEVVGKSPRPAETAGTPHRIRVGGNVQATKLISMVKPAYPPGAEAAGIEGTVMLKAVISTGGDLLNLSVLNTAVDPELASSAMAAVQQWHYQPTLLNGEPVEVVTTIAVTFRLEH